VNFEDLNAFVTVARLRSFSKASTKLRIAISSLSKRVQRLEHGIGSSLLVRHSKGVSLTSAGTVVLERAGALLDRFENLEREVFSALQTPSGTVRVGMPPATCRFLAPTVYARCKAEFPLLTPVIRVGTSDAIHNWLVSDELDLAVMYNAEEASNLVTEPLLVEPLFVIGPVHDPATGEKIRYPDAYALKDLPALPLLANRRPHSIRVLLDRLCAKYGMRLNIVCEVDGVDMMKGMISDGHGVGIFGYAGLRDELQRGEFVAIPFAFPLLTWTLCMVTPKRDHASAAVGVARRVILERIATLMKQGFWRDARTLPALESAGGE
jgi:LysR family transcriptional regulator, nitrogen assimilation regulatory protein